MTHAWGPDAVVLVDEASMVDLPLMCKLVDAVAPEATLLLVGIAMAAFCSALIGFLTYIASESELQSLVFWQMGSLARASWSDVVAVLPDAGEQPGTT